MAIPDWESYAHAARFADMRTRICQTVPLCMRIAWLVELLPACDMLFQLEPLLLLSAVVGHLMHYYNPHLQRYCIRILWMVRERSTPRAEAGVESIKAPSPPCDFTSLLQLCTQGACTLQLIPKQALNLPFATRRVKINFCLGAYLRRRVVAGVAVS